MGRMSARAAAMSGFGWGVLGGIVLVGLMYLAASLLALRPLTVAGSGFLGLNDGLARPIEWGVLFVAYGMVLELGLTPDASAADPRRRSLLAALPVGIGAVSLGLVGLLRVPNWYQAVANPP